MRNAGEQSYREPPPEKADFDRLSEVATYRLLRTTSIPVPSVYDFALSSIRKSGNHNQSSELNRSDLTNRYSPCGV